MIADRRSQNVLRSSAIIWKHHSAIVCDPAIMIADDRRDRLRCDHMEICDRNVSHNMPYSELCFLETRLERMREDGNVSKETDYGSSCPVFATKTVNI